MYETATLSILKNKMNDKTMYTKYFKINHPNKS